MIKKVAIYIVFLPFIWKGFAQDFKVNINKLTEETQQLSESPDKMRMVWWIPTDFWEAVFSQDASIPTSDADKMLAQFEKYTMVATIDGDIDTDGNIQYVSEDDIFNTLKVVDNTQQEFSPLTEDQIDLDTKRLITIMKPVLGNMLGKLGENMHFFLFQRTDDPLHKIVNPKNKESFAVKLNDERFEWQLPLGSLLRPQKCPVDQQLLDGSWTYCPYHGKPLTKY
ncbi:MAG: hypothetical protein HKN90_04825 [Flavobacteriaceae bacterium]|nr:hypothetical protein [Flavobacteriaceae bacterium]